MIKSWILWLLAMAVGCGGSSAQPIPMPKPEPAASPIKETPSEDEQEEKELKGTVRIEAGSFLMGSPITEQRRFPNEKQHKVTLTRAFEMKRTEVTQEEWEAIMGNNPSRFTACGANCPVEGVSWYEAIVYCNRLSSKEGLETCYKDEGKDYDERSASASKTPSWPKGLGCLGYRLPTEAEWEYAARAGTKTSTHAGELEILGDRNAPLLDGIAWYGGNSGVDYEGAINSSGWDEKQQDHERAGTHPVGGKQANAWGLYDMLGNLGEWTWDWDGEYATEDQTNPLGPTTGMYRVVRGGSWFNLAAYCRSAFRFNERPDEGSLYTGFRVSKTVP